MKKIKDKHGYKGRDLFLKIFYHIRYKYYALQNMTKHLSLDFDLIIIGKDEMDRVELLDSLEVIYLNKDSRKVISW